jgi:septal ring factor EnvC (AmiA/AmiB activator)
VDNGYKKQLDEIWSLLNEIARGQSGHDRAMREHRLWLREHDKALQEHEKAMAEYEVFLRRHTEILADHDERMDRVGRPWGCSRVWLTA